MDNIGPAPAGNPLVERIKAILLSPKIEWQRIDTETTSTTDIFKTYVVPLAAIGPVASLIGSLVFGYGAFGITYRPSIMAALSTAIASYVFALIGIYVTALVIDALAPQFGGTKNSGKAFKVAAYGATASWLAGIFGILPSLAFLSLAGLYSLYLIYTGLPVLMKSPEDKAIPYTAVIVLVFVVLGLLFAAITTPIAMMFGGGAAASMADAGTVSGTLNVPGAGSVDMSKLEEATKKLEGMSTAAKSGTTVPAIAPDVLAGLLPAALPGGLTRTSIESSSAGAGGIGGSTAEAKYGSGDAEVRLSVTDMGALGAIAAMGSAFNVQSSKQTSTGYERTGKVDGRMTNEEFDTSDKHGSYGTLVADRVMVKAEGHAPSIDALKAAVVAVDLARVEALAK